MIAYRRLRRVERVVQAEYERERAERFAAGNFTDAERVELMERLILDAAECRARGDFDNEIVRRAERMGELIAIARRLMEAGDAA